MTTVDENTRIAMEVVAQSFKLSEQTLLYVLESLTKLLENKEKAPKDYVFDEKTKVGKQKISELIEKHNKDGGVVALDENLTKQQLRDYQKELKKLGVDFSVVKNGKEDYSFFFSAAQANVIEKALKNIVERKNAVLDKEEVKNAEKSLNEVREDLTPEQSEKVKEIYDEISTSEDKKPKENVITYDRLSKKEKLLYSKLEELDEIKRSLFSQEVERVENLFENRYKQNVDVEKSIENELTEKDTKSVEEKEISSQKPLEKVRSIVSNLDEKEQALLYQKVGLIAERVSENEYKEMQKNFSPEQIEKIEKIASENISSDVKQGNVIEGKLNPDVYSALLNKVIKENERSKGNLRGEETENSQKENPKQKKVQFSMDGVKQIDKKIKAEQKETAKEKQKQQSISR
ncbi:DUF3801 domain-containing protein [Priestia megaterium]|uniref:DUF3801 domain-containing protein n=1 Tax=Priestia megaterium TaxID=1404 RepID=UPI001A947267|nr:DUF3801 domain-containing protein [Priestia megaterium]QSX24477.1 DUF3801 domain-containing protein [Priestia megaterium]